MSILPDSEEFLIQTMNDVIFPTAPAVQKTILEFKDHLIGFLLTKGVWYKLRVWIIDNNYKQRLKIENLLQEKYFQLHHLHKIIKLDFKEQFFFTSSCQKKLSMLFTEYRNQYQNNSVPIFNCQNELSHLRNENLFNLEYFSGLEEYKVKFDSKMMDIAKTIIITQSMSMETAQTRIKIISKLNINSREEIFQNFSEGEDNQNFFFSIYFNDQYQKDLKINQLKEFIEFLKLNKLVQMLKVLNYEQNQIKCQAFNFVNPQFYLEQQFKCINNINVPKQYQSYNKLLLRQFCFEVRDLDCYFVEYFNESLSLDYCFIAMTKNQIIVRVTTRFDQIQDLISILNDKNIQRLMPLYDVFINKSIVQYNDHMTISEKSDYFKKGSILQFQQYKQIFAALYLNEQFVLQIINLKGCPSFNSLTLEEFLDNTKRVTQIEFLFTLHSEQELEEKAEKCLQKITNPQVFKQITHQHPMIHYLATQVFRYILAVDEANTTNRVNYLRHSLHY